MAFMAPTVFNLNLRRASQAEFPSLLHSHPASRPPQHFQVARACHQSSLFPQLCPAGFKFCLVLERHLVLAKKWPLSFSESYEALRYMADALCG